MPEVPEVPEPHDVQDEVEEIPQEAGKFPTRLQRFRTWKMEQYAYSLCIYIGIYAFISMYMYRYVCIYIFL